MKFTCVDAFSGAGGLSLGLSRAGCNVVLSFDNDQRCVETQKNNPKYLSHKVICEDINQLIKRDPLKVAGLKKGDLFVLSGGPPCQGFSVQRIGKDLDERNDLVDSYISLLEIYMPKYFLMENVPGIKGKRGNRIFERALTRAKALGYYIHKETLNAQHYLTPQRRNRVFVVGERADLGEPCFSFPVPTQKRVTVRQAIGHLPPPPEDCTNHPDIPNHRRDRLSEKNLQRIKAIRQGEGRTSLPEHLLADCHRRGADVIGHRNVYGRMEWDDVAPTITARFDSFTRGKFGHPEQHRTISLREGALLQTFPEDFVFCGNKVDVARQIGNAVPVTLAEILGRQIVKCDLEKGR